MSQKIEKDWDNASWVGSRRALIRQSLKLSVRERLQAQEDLIELSNKLPSIKTTNKSPK